LTQRKNRDQAVDRLLGSTLRKSHATEGVAPCPDVELLAAWTDGALSGADRAATEAHVAGCPRCQAQLAAMARMTSGSPADLGPTKVRLVRWLVPLAAGATGLAIWIWVQPAAPPVSAPKSPQAATSMDRPASSRELARGAAQEPRRDEADRPADSASPRANTSPPPTAAPALTEKREQEQFEAARDRAKETVTLSNRRRAATPEPSAAPEAAGAELASPASKPVDIVSPDPAIRWQVHQSPFTNHQSPFVRASMVQHSTNGGKTWDRQSIDLPASLVAGASPSSTVCWLVGRSGIVLITRDGRNWARVSFPEAIDLVAIRAADEKNATVTTADGRALTTVDGGATWSERPMQDF
jgi:hypothetical protein